MSLAVAACATATQGPRRNSNLITREELADLPVSNAWEAVQRLRSQWLNRPTAATIQPGGNPILVYVDRHQMGGLEELRNVGIDQIEQMEFVSARDATTRYGTGHPSGIIEVTTRRGG